MALYTKLPSFFVLLKEAQTYLDGGRIRTFRIYLDKGQSPMLPSMPRYLVMYSESKCNDTGVKVETAPKNTLPR